MGSKRKKGIVETGIPLRKPDFCLHDKYDAKKKDWLYDSKFKPSDLGQRLNCDYEELKRCMKIRNYKRRAFDIHAIMEMSDEIRWRYCYVTFKTKLELNRFQLAFSDLIA